MLGGSIVAPLNFAGVLAEDIKRMPKTIMMIHAACGSHRSWEFYRPWFEERGWEVLTPNLRLHDGEPHGASGGHALCG